MMSPELQLKKHLSTIVVLVIMIVRLHKMDKVILQMKKKHQIQIDNLQVIGNMKVLQIVIRKLEVKVRVISQMNVKHQIQTDNLPVIMNMLVVL